MMTKKRSAEKTVRDIRRATRRHYFAEKKFGIDKLTNEGGLGCHIVSCFGMDRGLQTPH